MNILYIILGIIMISIGLSYTFFNLNLLVIGYNYIEYFLYLIKSIEFWFIIIGIIIIIYILKKT